jgi:retinol dehydrogenase-12
LSPSSPPSGRPRVAVITGATSGIGKEVARGLAAQGLTTVIVGRDAKRATAVAAELATATSNPRVEPLGGHDLSVIGEVKQLAAQLLNRYPEIHVVVNNAGAYFAHHGVTPDGIEQTFALNVLAPFTLTSLLADRLRVSAPSRFVEVASSAHRGYSVDLAQLQSGAKYEGYATYGRSKLELILLSREFARRLAGTGVTVNAVHPGFIKSRFGENNPGGTGLGFRLIKMVFARSLPWGSRNVLYVATDPAAASISGEYFYRRRVERASPESYDMEMARKLFEACRGLAGTPDLPDPGPAAPSGASPPPHQPAVSPG